MQKETFHSKSQFAWISFQKFANSYIVSIGKQDAYVNFTIARHMLCFMYLTAQHTLLRDLLVLIKCDFSFYIRMCYICKSIFMLFLVIFRFIYLPKGASVYEKLQFMGFE